MIIAGVQLHGDGALDEERKAGKEIVHVQTSFMKFIRLERGMKSGASSVAFAFEHEGKILVLETSMACFLNAACLFDVADIRMREGQ